MNDRDGFRDVYYIIWFLPSSKSIGEVRNYTSDLTRYRSIRISLGDDALKKMNRRFLMTEWTVSGPKILINKAFMAVPRSLREAGIWHEVGHIHYRHGYEQAGSQRGPGTSSATATDFGTSLASDKEADCFAVRQSSKEAVKGFLEYLLRTRPSRGGGPNEVPRRELEARIAYIRTY